MGSYYEGTIKRKDDTIKSYNTHDVGNGLKLMEHSYVGNEYVDRVLSMLEKESAQLSWVCDYSDDHPWNWATAEEQNKETFLADSHLLDDGYIVLNHTKKMYIDMTKYVKENKNDEWLIHPIPLLCNSSGESLGGGDYHYEWMQRNSWDMDEIQIKYGSAPKGYQDVSTDVLVYEE